MSGATTWTGGGASPVAVTANTLLGDNAVAALGHLVTHLEATTGLAMRFEGRDGTRSSADVCVWNHDLVWACGLLTVRELDAGRAAGEIVAAPVFTGETGPRYRSLVVCRHEARVGTVAELAHCRIAINETASWSGCHCLLAHLGSHRQVPGFASVTMTGSHRGSLAAVAAGRADAAAIDHTVWTHLVATEPGAVHGLVAIDRTGDWPAPPFTLARGLDGDVRGRLLTGLFGVRPGEVPGLERIVPVQIGAYRPMARLAAGQGVPPGRPDIGG